MASVLTDKQERFCYEYCIDYNATQAAIRAGYSSKTAAEIGRQALNKKHIKDKIKQLQESLAETAGISALRVIQEHAKIAFSNAGQIRDGWMKLKDFENLTDDEKACIQSVSTKTTKRNIDGEEVEDVFVNVKMYDKQKSLDSISKMLGFDAPIKQEITGKDGSELFPVKDQKIIFENYDG